MKRIAAALERIASALEQLVPALQQATREARRVPRRTTDKGEHCDDCGQAYSDVYWVDDELWQELHERAPAGLLCPSCLVRRAQQATREQRHCGHDLLDRNIWETKE